MTVVLEPDLFVAHGFPVEFEDPEFRRRVSHPGAHYRFGETPWRISRRAQRHGEHAAGSREGRGR